MDLDLLVLLDRSGSMQDAKKDHEGGLRSFVEDQRDVEGDVRLTFIQFDTVDACEVIYDRVPLAEVKTEEIVLLPRSGTPLLDAVGRGVTHLRSKLPPGRQVVVLVITDGEENSSHEWTKDRVKALVTELEAANWNFLFLGANIDAFAESGALGIHAASTLGYSNQGGAGTVNAMYAASSHNLLRARTVGSHAMKHGLVDEAAIGAAIRSSLTYTAEQRNAAMGVTHGSVSGGGDSQSDEKAEG
jgi:hypothetical protein